MKTQNHKQHLVAIAVVIGFFFFITILTMTILQPIHIEMDCTATGITYEINETCTILNAPAYGCPKPTNLQCHIKLQGPLIGLRWFSR